MTKGEKRENHRDDLRFPSICCSAFCIFAFPYPYNELVYILRFKLYFHNSVLPVKLKTCGFHNSVLVRFPFTVCLFAFPSIFPRCLFDTGVYNNKGS